MRRNLTESEKEIVVKAYAMALGGTGSTEAAEQQARMAVELILRPREKPRCTCNCVHCPDNPIYSSPDYIQR